MMMDIFSNFDPMWFKICYKSTIILMLLPFMMMTMFWTSYNKMILSAVSMMMLMVLQTKTTKLFYLKGTLLLLMTMFMFIIFMNLSGMLPYSFSVTSHIILTMSLGIPMWMFMMISSIMNSTKKSIAHLLPDSAPLWLNPFLVLIESMSIIIRPMTLSLRLAANMTAGHVILSLLSSFSISAKTKMLMTIMPVLTMYSLFEMGICLIQSYIFCLLISLYSNDHM